VNKAGYVGIIIALAIGIGLAVSFANIETPIEENVSPEEISKPETTEGQHFSVELTESMSVKQNP